MAWVLDSATARPVSPPLDVGILGSVAFAPDGRTLVSLAQKATVWDATSFTRVGEPIDPGRFGSVLAYSPNDRTFAIGGFDRSVSIWKPNAQPLFQQNMPATPPFGGTVSASGRLLALPSATDVTLYDARSRRQIGLIRDVPRAADVGIGTLPAVVALDHDGNTLARRWSLPDGLR
jgi:WD40 repeat protein